jgi:hypothetical protein
MEKRRFSKSIGLIPVSKMIQKDSIDQELAVSLFNVFYMKIIEEWGPSSRSTPEEYDVWERHVWSDFLNYTIDNKPDYPSTVLNKVKEKFFVGDWAFKYDFMQFNADVLKKLKSRLLVEYLEECNRVLEKESSAYRFIGSELSPIINQIEIESIDDAISNEIFPHVSTHLKSALRLLSDRQSPDYRNSIKESISAVETLCREITGAHTLGQAIKKFEASGVHFNLQFKAALEKLYVYTNDTSTGIRHSLMEEGVLLTFDEAKFMLVSCSAFANYLISKKKNNPQL